MNSDLLGLKPVTDGSLTGVSSGMAALVSQGIVFPSLTSTVAGVSALTPSSKNSSTNSQQSHGHHGDDAQRKREVRLLKNRSHSLFLITFFK